MAETIKSLIEMVDERPNYVGKPEDWERAKRALNILADKVESVVPYLAERVLANEKHGARIAWLTTPKVAMRFTTARFNKRDVVADMSLQAV